MMRAPQRLPAPLARCFDRLGSRGMALLLNHLLTGQEVAGRLPSIAGKCVAIEITDLGASLAWQIAGERLLPAADPASADLVIRGKWRDFARLALRAEDPDTLFFQRELCLEGETETGLYVKNLLDSLEFDSRTYLEAHFPPLVAARLGRLAERGRLGGRIARLRDAVRSRL